jgi:hypothetical protein
VQEALVLMKGGVLQTISSARTIVVVPCFTALLFLTIPDANDATTGLKTRYPAIPINNHCPFKKINGPVFAYYFLSSNYLATYVPFLKSTNGK